MSLFAASEGTKLQVAVKIRPPPTLRPEIEVHAKTAPITRKGSSTEGLRYVTPETHPADPFTTPEDDHKKDMETFHLSPPPQYPAGVEPRKLDVIFIGAGLSGMLFGMQSMWRLKNVNLRIFEMNAMPAGTWANNRYPGCRCDVQSFIYSLRHEPWDWTEGYGQWDEIYAYMTYLFDKYQLGRFTTLETAVVGCKWNEATGKWAVTTEHVRTKERAEHTCDVLINGQGTLNRAKMPDIPGLNNFKGSVVHTSNWDPPKDDPRPDYRVAVIGNGSTGLQVFGALAPKVKEIYHFARTPTFIRPFLDELDLPPERRDHWRRVGSENAGRAWREHARSVWRDREKFWGMVRSYRSPTCLSSQSLVKFTSRTHKLNKLVVSRALEYMETQIKDPELRRKLTPTFSYGCRRPIFSMDYYSVITLPHAHLVDDAIVRATADSLVTVDANGKETAHGPLDQIICATGFSVNWVNKYCPIVGRGGRTLAEVWADKPEGYRSVMVHGFPNYMMVGGPNMPLTHNSLYIVIEQVVNWINQFIVTLQTNPSIRSIDVKKSAQDAFNADSQDWLIHNSIWNEDCGGWYKLRNGYIAQWAGPGLHFMDSLYAPNWDHFDIDMRPIAGSLAVSSFDIVQLIVCLNSCAARHQLVVPAIGQPAWEEDRAQAGRFAAACHQVVRSCFLQKV
ncbi:hypothetical protein DFJ74DRAFT_638943 [Hyaloraphidium curvatum]|nr:hypothetical protein DFJ74DRAFT_638943 [Hyaloraphidium curvatum]